LLQYNEGNKGPELMEDKSISEFGKKLEGFSEGEMTSVALQQAKGWADQLLDKEFQGRGDKDYLARYRLAQQLGIKESYLFRLQYKTAEMKDVAGEVYRRIRHAYEEMCARNEEAADAYRAERLDLRKQHEANRGPASQGD
jgi:galactokinase